MADGNGQGKTGQALAVRTEAAPDLRTDRAAFEPASLPEAFELAGKLARSGLMPSSLRNPEAIVTAVIMGRELGLTAMQSVRSIHVIEGKPTLSSSLIVALCKKSPVCRYFRMVESTDERATYETLREGDPEPTRMSFTIQQARNAGVTGKGNWKNYPAAMLRARCETALARAVYPDLVMGLYDPDEVEPVRQGERDIIPRQQPEYAESRTVVVEAQKADPAPAPASAAAAAEPPAEPLPVDEATGEVLISAKARELLIAIGNAETQKDLNRIATASRKALEAGEITPAEKEHMRPAYEAKKAEVR